MKYTDFAVENYYGIQLSGDSSRQRELARGDKQHGTTAYFGVNGGRVAEVANGTCDHPTAPTADESNLPPPGPYVGAKSVSAIRGILSEAVELIESAGNGSDEAALAIEALKIALKKLA